MIYIKRFGWFLLVVGITTLFSILIALLVMFISEVFGVWGVVGLVVIIMMILAILDVQLEKRLNSSWRKLNEAICSNH